MWVNFLLLWVTSCLSHDENRKFLKTQPHYSRHLITLLLWLDERMVWCTSYLTAYSKLFVYPDILVFELEHMLCFIIVQQSTLLFALKSRLFISIEWLHKCVVRHQQMVETLFILTVWTLTSSRQWILYCVVCFTYQIIITQTENTWSVFINSSVAPNRFQLFGINSFLWSFRSVPLTVSVFLTTTRSIRLKTCFPPQQG